MRIVIASDHRGFDAKMRLIPRLTQGGHTVEDMGCRDMSAVDYPDLAIPAARKVADGTFDVGILLDGSGIGMSICANRIKGVRAALAHDEFTARRARAHNHCNVLCLGTDLLGEEHIMNIVEIFLNTNFEPGRHQRRVEKVDEMIG